MHNKYFAIAVLIALLALLPLLYRAWKGHGPLGQAD